MKVLASQSGENCTLVNLTDALELARLALAVVLVVAVVVINVVKG